MEPGMGQHPTDAGGQSIEVSVARRASDLRPTHGFVKAAERGNRHRQAGDDLPVILVVQRGKGLAPDRCRGWSRSLTMRRNLSGTTSRSGVQRQAKALRDIGDIPLQQSRSALSVPATQNWRCPGRLPMVAGVCAGLCSATVTMGVYPITAPASKVTSKSLSHILIIDGRRHKVTSSARSMPPVSTNVSHPRSRGDPDRSGTATDQVPSECSPSKPGDEDAEST
ncbi:hypothetical protein OI25_8198 (plasmid) [Paraburkholderia fungorum]|jgi:hypothetical protein|uniref:Uncharacterized protein n=1 Tax=Paraburkholderia fungorum TaxID=134537 RepID=A0AAW3V276_9BURK|nr:hypothetical protein OI25_8198 [Paraburkholderia fungorum]MBB4516503.1 hypothetical protein [Paraburkholderia fungorum]MBB5545240.1 hypothetical protein [Paraburkholderia fungorum]MBB6205024.1 hypothetical protein [Paraburkholderia fungorum]PRZ52501.1 hypothetical protein BX589_114175 [Paraburkholderia fungorum]